MNFKISLKAARVNAGLTQAVVSDKLHVDKGTIINWERGRTSPTLPQTAKLCELYGVPIDYIFIPCNSTLSEKL